MKSALILLAFTISFNAFSEDQKRNETRTRIVGEKLVSVGKCSEVKTSSYDSTETFINRNGETKTRPITVIEASATLPMSKCQTQESFMVEVTGSGWFAKSSEIPNSARASSTLVSQSQTITKSQSVKLNNASNGITLGGSNSATLVMTIADGLKAQVLDECKQQTAQLKQTITDSKEDCR